MLARSGLELLSYVPFLLFLIAVDICIFVVMFLFFVSLLVNISISMVQLLVPLVSAFRYEGDEVNMTLAKKEAKILREAITDKKYNDDELIRILSTRSKAQLNATLNHYNNEFGNPINKVFASLSIFHHEYFSQSRLV